MKEKTRDDKIKELHGIIGSSIEGHGSFERGIEAANELVSLANPQEELWGEAHTSLADVLWEAGKCKEALQACEIAFKFYNEHKGLKPNYILYAIRAECLFS